MQRLGFVALATVLAPTAACEHQAPVTEVPAPATATSELEAPGDASGSTQAPTPASATPPTYADYLLPEHLMPRFDDLVSECPDERVCMFEHDGSVLVGKKSWEGVLMVNFMTPHYPVQMDDPSDELWRARIEYAVRALLEARGENEAMIHCDLAEELPDLLPSPPADEKSCHEGPRQAGHWTPVGFEPDPARIEQLLSLIGPAEAGRRAAWSEHLSYEAKEESLGGRAGMKFRFPDVQGSLDHRAVTSVLMRKRRHVDYCYIDGLLVDPALAGEIEFHIEIAASGSVSSTEVAVNTMSSADVARCIAHEIDGWPFPAASTGGTTRVVWRPEFEPPRAR